MTTFIEEVRELGVKRAVIAKTDDIVERVTTGMNISDIRSALRGDEPRRPNPRLRPHADGFWFHIRPSFYHTEVTHIYPTFRLGWLSTFMFVWETITGIFLMIFYTPSPLVAYDNMWNIMSNVPLGQLMRNMHRFGAEAMVLVVALHMLRTYVTGSYKKPRQFTWLTGMLLLCLTLILSFSGYLLPWDQLAYWAVTVAVSATSAMPSEALAKNMDLLVRGAPSIGENGLLRFYLLHVLALPLITAIFIFVHYYKVVLHGHSLPPGREAIGEDTAKRVPKDERVYFTPDIMSSEVMWIGLATLFLVGGAMFLPVGVGQAAIESHANPTNTPLHVVAPWYLAWSQGWLKILPTFWVAFVMIPVLAVPFFIWPYLEVGKSRRYIDRRAGLILVSLFMAFMLISNYMGSPKFAVRGSADQEVSQELLPQEGHSVVLEVPYDEWFVGQFLPGDELYGKPHLTHAMHEFKISMQKWACTLQTSHPYLKACRIRKSVNEGVQTTHYDTFFAKDVMVDPEAYLEVSQEQQNVYKLQFVFRAEDPNNPGTFNFDSSSKKYRHADSYYEGY